MSRNVSFLSTMMGDSSPGVHPPVLNVQVVVIPSVDGTQAACAEPAPRVERAAPPSRPAVRRALGSMVVLPFIVVLNMVIKLEIRKDGQAPRRPTSSSRNFELQELQAAS
jgi:hypothetical protein